MRRLLVLLLVLMPALAASAGGHTHVATVVHVADGDTLTVILQGVRARIELAGIDAPETDQPHGASARRALATLVFNKQVHVAAPPHGVADGYQITLGRQDVAGILVAAGHAWALPGGVDTARLQQLQMRARQRAAGLWGHAVPIEPWRWRTGNRVPSGSS